VAGRIRSIEKSNECNGNRTHNLLACSNYATACPYLEEILTNLKLKEFPKSGKFQIQW
jgi:hypothetical protein